MESKRTNLSSQEALELLLEGNSRYVEGLRTIGSLSQIERTKELAGTGQYPFCVVITCSDSRFPVEILFDRGPGDIFVVRSFGTLIDPLIVATVEYAVVNFNIQLVLVLGNPVSGAFRLAMESENQEEVLKTRHVEKVVNTIRPSLHHAKMKENCFQLLDRSNEEDKETWDRIIKLTCHYQTLTACNDLIKMSPLLESCVNGKGLHISGTTINIDTGRVFDHTKIESKELISSNNIEFVPGVKSVRK